MPTKPILVKRTDLPDFKEYSRVIKKLWKSKWITNNGVYAKQLVIELKKYLGVPHLALLTNGTITLHIALKVLNLPKGGEIITTPFTFAATTNIIIWEGFTPVFVDIDPDTWNIDPKAIENAITSRTVAIMPVHVYGNPCDVEVIEQIAKKHNLKVIYDAAHAFGVEYKGKSVLNYGDFSSLSFHATKVFHTIEGGALITPNESMHEQVEYARNFGIVEFEDQISFAGTNGKMNEFQAAMGLCNVPNLETQRLQREKVFQLYVSLLSNNSKVRLQKNVASKQNYAYMPIVLENIEAREKVITALNKSEIYPRKYFYPLTSDFPFINPKSRRHTHIAKSVSDGALCLPLYSDLRDQEVTKIAEIVIKNLS